jgi:hypothetical protein
MAGQYLNTSEGKESVKRLRNGAPEKYKSLSDQELVNQAINNSKAFEQKGQNISFASTAMNKTPDYNPAESFKSRMTSDIKNNKAGINYKTNNSFAIHADNKDDYLYPTMSRVTDALNSQDQLNFSSEGKSGLVFRNKDGKTFTPSDKPVFTNTFVDIGADGVPVLKATGYVGKGGDKAVVTTTMDLHATNPVTSDIKIGLEKEIAQAKATGNYHLIEPMARTLAQFDPQYLGTLKQLKEAPITGAKPQNFKMKGQDNVETTTAQKGFKSRVLKTETVTGKTYSIHVGQDELGKKVYFQTTPEISLDGLPTGKQVVTALHDGSQFATDPDVIAISNTINQVIAKTPVETKITKIPQGTVQAITNFAGE